MCLAVPMQIETIDGMNAQAVVNGVRRAISLMLLPDIQVGEFVLVHAGFAIERVRPEEARHTAELLTEVDLL